MGDSATKTSLVGGWIKAGATSVFGLASGAVIMWLTPLFNSAIKPPKPVANFAHEAQGMTVSFSNRCTGASQGWWDFGDGSALEPFSPEQSTVTHTYKKAAPYTVKLAVENLFDESHERTATIEVGTQSPEPVIERFEVIPLSPGMTAPAVFRVIAKVKDAELVIWNYGETKPMEVCKEPNKENERWVTITEPGSYLFRLVAVNGKNTTEKMSEPQWVGMAENAPQATVRVTYEAVQVERKEEILRVPAEWKSNAKGETCGFTAERSVPGYQIVSAELDRKHACESLKGEPKVVISPDRGKVTVTGELAKLANGKAPPVSVVPLKVTLEKRSRPQSKPMEVPMYVQVPGSTRIPLPKLSPEWQATKASVSLELKEGSKVVWSGAQMPAATAMQLKNRPVVVTGNVQEGQVLLKVDNNPAALRPFGN